jgi:hypothetical protein
MFHIIINLEAMESIGLKKKIAIIALTTMLTLTIFSQMIFPPVNAVDVKITSITPSTKRGKGWRDCSRYWNYKRNGRMVPNLV